MITSVANLYNSTPADREVESPLPGQGFDAALKAAQRKAAQEEARKTELDAIRDKGFSDWVRDTQIEKLKEQLRRKVMAEMGLKEEDLSAMTAAMRQVLEAKIMAEVESRMEKELAKDAAGGEEGETGEKGAAVAQAQGEQPGKNDPPGKKVPVIPGLAWPGGASIF